MFIEHFVLLIGAEIYTNAHFGEGTGPIAFTNVACSGIESNLMDCDYSTDLGTCTHSDDVGASCQEGESVILQVKRVQYLLIILF